jgi:Tol biopolymer transport system component
VAEYDWSSDGARLVYHTPGPGDPMFVKDAGRGNGRLILTAAPGRHAHFPLWSPDQAFIYFVQGVVPGAMDIWRIAPGGGEAERITHHDSRVSHPVMPDPHTLLYLACDADGSGPWIYSVDVERRVPTRVSPGVDRYASLAASADGRRLVATIASPKRTLWRMPMADAASSAPRPIALSTGSGFSPRLGPGYVLYVASRGTSDSIWKLADGGTTEVWTAPAARITGSPEIDPGGGRIAFSVALAGKTTLYVMNADGTDARVLAASLDLRGSPAWAPGGSSITTAVNVDGTPRLFDVPLDGSPARPLANEYSIDPVWAPDGGFVVYSGADVGTTFRVEAAGADGARHPLPDLTLTRGARRLRFAGGRALVVMRGDMQHKDLWQVDLETGAERQLTHLAPDFDVRDFDLSPDGREIVLERLQGQSDLVLLETAAR